MSDKVNLITSSHFDWFSHLSSAEIRRAFVSLFKKLFHIFCACSCLTNHPLAVHMNNVWYCDEQFTSDSQDCHLLWTTRNSHFVSRLQLLNLSWPTKLWLLYSCTLHWDLNWTWHLGTLSIRKKRKHVGIWWGGGPHWGFSQIPHLLSPM